MGRNSAANANLVSTNCEVGVFVGNDSSASLDGLNTIANNRFGVGVAQGNVSLRGFEDDTTILSCTVQDNEVNGVFAVSLGSALGGQVLIEVIFRWPGMGREIVQSVARLCSFLCRTTKKKIDKKKTW